MIVYKGHASEGHPDSRLRFVSCHVFTPFEVVLLTTFASAEQGLKTLMTKNHETDQV